MNAHSIRFLILLVGLGVLATPLLALELDEVIQRVPEGLELVPYDYVAYKGLYSKKTHTGFVSYTEIKATNYCPLRFETGKRPKFSPDLDLMGEDLVVHEDYANNENIDRGHLTSNGIFKTKDDANRTFFLTNVAPQYVSFNGGIWARMEHCARFMIDVSCRTRFNWGIITGIVPSHPGDPNAKVLNNKVAVPAYFYKIIFTLDTKKPFLYAYVMPNSPTISLNDDLRKYQKSLQEIEELTGVTFFTARLREQFDTTKVGFKPFGTQTCAHSQDKRDRALELGIMNMLENSHLIKRDQ